MLQLNNTVIITSVRTNSRFSWWNTTQNLLSTSSMATKPNPKLENAKNNVMKKTQSKSKIKHYDPTLISAAFKSMQISKESETDVIHQEINDKINTAQNLNELLNISKDPLFNKQNASAIIHVLFNWVTAKKIKIDEIVNDRRYLKLCELLEIDLTSSKLMTKMLQNTQPNSSEKQDASVYEFLQFVTNNPNVEKLSNSKMINVLTFLASKQKRSKPVLQAISARITNSSDEFNIKQLADILYSITVLNFYDDALIKKVCKNLCEVIPVNEKPSVIKSILNSLGLLRYKDKALIDLLTKWIIDHQKIIKSQEIYSLLKTLACLGYLPGNFNIVLQDIITPLKESDMSESSEWLDIVWSLCVLNQASPKHYSSILNSDFLNRIDQLSIPRQLKILNINAAASLLKSDYKGPLLPKESELFSISILKTIEKIALSNSIISALKILLPSDSVYLNTNVDTKMGFFIDAEFCIDEKCTPVPLNSHPEGNNKIFRIAVLTCSYQEFCRGVSEVIGPIILNKNLLNGQGYKVLMIPYTDINAGDSLTTRVSYIKEKIKLLVQNPPSTP